MTNLLFDTPWWLPTSLLVLGIVLFITGNNRQEFRVRTIGLIVAVLAILLAVVSFCVDTDREKAEKGTRTLVKSVEARDWTTMQNLLASRASVGIQGAGTKYSKREEVIDGAKMAVDLYGLKEVMIKSLDAQQQQTLITVTFDAISQQTSAPYPIVSTWQFEWQRTPEGLKVVRITCLQIGSQTGSGAGSRFPSAAPKP